MSLRFISVIARESYSNQESFFSLVRQKNDVKASPIRRLQRGKSDWKSVQTGSRRKKKKFRSKQQRQRMKKRKKIGYHVFPRTVESKLIYAHSYERTWKKKFLSSFNRRTRKNCHQTNIHKVGKSALIEKRREKTITDEKLQWNERIVLSWKNIIPSFFFLFHSVLGLFRTQWRLKLIAVHIFW